MVLSAGFACPTRIVSGENYADAVAELLDGRSWALVTSRGWMGRGAAETLATSCGAPRAVLATVPPNPKVSDVVELARELPEIEVLVALGGGSVIDCAKGVAALRAIDGNKSLLLDHLQNTAPLGETFAPVPTIAVPTTSGTGAEVTRWATIWGDDRIKYSLMHPALYPSHAVLDPALCRSMPREVTLYTALDALSHSMESVWNRRSTPLSDQLACRAIAILRARLVDVLEHPEDIAARRDVQLAAVLAGLAMSTTQTALAHSISYPFTALFGMPHGFACSFTLAEVARFNREAEAARLSPIAEGFDVDTEALPAAVEGWLRELGIGRYISLYVNADQIDGFKDDLITRARAANNLRSVDGATARAIARRAFEKLTRS